jgi:hypothetical protein
MEIFAFAELEKIYFLGPSPTGSAVTSVMDNLSGLDIEGPLLSRRHVEGEIVGLSSQAWA